MLFRPGGTKLNAIVEVHLDRILKAVLIFKGMMIEWVVVKGWEEELVKQDTGQPDIWGESRYHVSFILMYNTFFLLRALNVLRLRCSNVSQKTQMQQCSTFSLPYTLSLLSSLS